MSSSPMVRKLEIKQVCGLIDKYYDSSIYEGIILCEGDENSIDVKLYSKIYPHLLVIPVGGCTDVIKIINSIRKRNEYKKVWGLIDRDATSKKDIHCLKKEKGVYCTKLPFIENIICTPEVIKIICRYLNYDYKKTIKSIKESLLKVLTNKIKDALPVNVSISKDDLIESISFSVKLQNGLTVEKTINESSGLYTFRDKTIANIVADALHLKGRQAYYGFIEKLLNTPEVSYDLIKVMRTYLPIIK